MKVVVDLCFIEEKSAQSKIALTQCEIQKFNARIILN